MLLQRVACAVAALHAELAAIHARQVVEIVTEDARQALGRQRDEPRADVGTPFEQVDGFRQPHGLTQRAAASVETLGQYRLAELAAGRDIPFDDRGAELIEHASATVEPDFESAFGQRCGSTAEATVSTSVASLDGTGLFIDNNRCMRRILAASHQLFCRQFIPLRRMIVAASSCPSTPIDEAPWLLSFVGERSSADPSTAIDNSETDEMGGAFAVRLWWLLRWLGLGNGGGVELQGSHPWQSAGRDRTQLRLRRQCLSQFASDGASRSAGVASLRGFLERVDSRPDAASRHWH